MPPCKSQFKLQAVHAVALAYQNFLLYSEPGFWTQVCREKLPQAHFLFVNEWDAFRGLVGLDAVRLLSPMPLSPDQSQLCSGVGTSQHFDGLRHNTLFIAPSLISEA